MKQLIFVISGILILMFITGCSSKSDPIHFEKEHSILYAEFMQEVNSFNPVYTTERDFKADHLYFGDEVLESALQEGKQLAGFLSAVDELGGGKIKLIPILQAKSMSGGPIDSLFYFKIRDKILAGVKAHPEAAGIYLSMHGAMGVQGMFDPEGEIMTMVRELRGEDFVLAVSYDLHANNTVRRAESADLILGYHTNPHRDHFETGYKAGKLLLRAVAGEIDPVMVVNKMPLLKGGGMNVDFLKPFNKIFRAMKKMEKEEDVLSVSFFPIHIWIDDPELGYTTIAITDGNAVLAQEKADQIADMAWEVRAVPQPAGNSPEEAIDMARKARLARMHGVVVFCDVSDAVGTGTPGESTWILKALVEKSEGLISYITIRDEVALTDAWSHEVGETISMNLGGKIDTVYSLPYTYTGKITFKEETDYGKTMILEHEGIKLVVSELPMALRDPDEYRDLGLKIMKADIVVVKNLFPFRYMYLLQNRKTINVITPGLSNIRVEELNYKHIPRPIYPLDDVKDWR